LHQAIKTEPFKQMEKTFYVPPLT